MGTVWVVEWGAELVLGWGDQSVHTMEFAMAVVLAASRGEK